jgi:hypothetical protein
LGWLHENKSESAPEQQNRKMPKFQVIRESRTALKARFYEGSGGKVQGAAK